MQSVFMCAQKHGPFIHFVAVGARPEAQGKGVGSKLLGRVLRYADEHSLPAYLEVGCPLQVHESSSTWRRGGRTSAPGSWRVCCAAL